MVFGVPLFLLPVEVLKCLIRYNNYAFVLRNGLPVYKELKYLAEVKRFSMAVMFLSDKDKKGT